MKRKLTTLCTLLLVGITTAWAQMTFTLNGVTYSDVAETNSKGLTTVTLPSGTNLSGLISDVVVDGFPVDANEVTPNPTTTTINYDEIKVFTYNNKAYGFRFVEDVWFCAVFFSDCHINQGSGHDGTIQEDMTTIMNNILNMGKDGTKKVSFTTAGATNLIPKTSIVFCLGDIDQDKGDDGSSGTHTNFLNCTAELAKTAGIPLYLLQATTTSRPTTGRAITPTREPPQVAQMPMTRPSAPSPTITTTGTARVFSTRTSPTSPMTPSRATSKVSPSPSSSRTYASTAPRPTGSRNFTRNHSCSPVPPITPPMALSAPLTPS